MDTWAPCRQTGEEQRCRQRQGNNEDPVCKALQTRSAPLSGAQRQGLECSADIVQDPDPQAREQPLIIFRLESGISCSFLFLFFFPYTEVTFQGQLQYRNSIYFLACVFQPHRWTYVGKKNGSRQRSVQTIFMPHVISCLVAVSPGAPCSFIFTVSFFSFFSLASFPL